MTAHFARRLTAGVKEVGKTSSAADRAQTVPSDTDHEAGAARPGRGCDGELANLNLAPLGREARTQVFQSPKQVFWRTFRGLGALAFPSKGKGLNFVIVATGF